MKRGLVFQIVLVLLVAGFYFGNSLMGSTIKGQLNINTATKSELIKLPFVGSKLADNIIALRTKAPFNAVSDLEKVKGLGKKKLAKLAQYVKFTGASDLVVAEGKNS